jgi:hypothetical protein
VYARGPHAPVRLIATEAHDIPRSRI